MSAHLYRLLARDPNDGETFQVAAEFPPIVGDHIRWSVYNRAGETHHYLGRVTQRTFERQGTGIYHGNSNVQEYDWYCVLDVEIVPLTSSTAADGPDAEEE